MEAATSATTTISSTFSPQRQGEDDGQGRLVVFAPPVDEMYPLRGELQDLGKHQGVGVEMRGLGDVMEGRSRRES